jgi:large subunit ribosomal protein L5
MPAKEKPAKPTKGGSSAKEKQAEEPQIQEAPRETPRMKVRYREEIVPALMRRFGYTNPMQAPRLQKVSVNMGVGKATQDAKVMDIAVRDLTYITGQKAVITRAKKSIAGFRVRQKMAVGCRVTLRGDQMYEFLDRLFSVVLPRVRDFRGLSPAAVDGHGNYTLGIREQSIFPEIDLDKIERVQGMDVTIVTSARTDEEALGLLTELGLPLRSA